MKRVLDAISLLFILASPWVLYWTLTRQDIAAAAITISGWVVLRTIPILVAAKKEQRLAALQLPAIAITFSLLGWLLDNQTLLLVLPCATQGAFGLMFLRSLKSTPLIEHFARMVKPELRPEEVVHCRAWTRIWGICLLVLAGAGLVVAKVASLEVWTVYVGIVSYVLVGVIFMVEYVVRRIRFRDYGRNPLDWLLSKLFPPARPETLS